MFYGQFTKTEDLREDLHLITVCLAKLYT